MTDRRRINGPPSGTKLPVFANTLLGNEEKGVNRPFRTRHPAAVRKMCMSTSSIYGLII